MGWLRRFVGASPDSSVLIAAFAALGAAAHAENVGLDYQTPTAITIPVSSMPPAPAEFAVVGPFNLAGVVSGTRAYEAQLPVRPRALYYERQPEAMELFREGRKLAYTADPAERSAAGSWEINRESVVVRVREEVSRPANGLYTMRYPKATEREESLRFRGGNPVEWAFRSAQLDEVTRHGILLPAPASVEWNVDALAGAHLRMELAVLPPEIEESIASDGADLTVRVNGTDVQTVRVEVGEFRTVSVALGAVGKVRVELVTSDTDVAVDHVFVASPSVYVPSANPKRVILAFIDTLRRDHLGTYGYKRETTPDLDTWAAQSTVFEDARTVAPWTLPSTRSLWTGRQPEWWSESNTLQETLAGRGWATGAYVGNVYLSSNFEMDRGWGEHHCVNWPGANYEVRHARDFLERHADQDALLMVHFMDLHLPYKEPVKYRRMWAKTDPPGLEPYFNRTILMREAGRARELLRPYLIDRYDQNLRYVNDELAPFLGDLPSNATVVLFADHGEEFFDHGDLEHGHTLYDELLRVPLVIRSPNLPIGRVEGPVSLLDVAPTLVELLELPADTLPKVDGRSLLPASRGQDPELAHRALAFGRVLYGPEQWASLADGEKYVTTRGKESVYNLLKDPHEREDLAESGADIRPGRQALAESLGRDVVQAFRISPVGRPQKPIEVEFHVPGGAASVWVGPDPTDTTRAQVISTDGDFVRMKFVSKLRENREVYVVPNLPADDVVATAEIRIIDNATKFEPLRARPHDGSGSVLSKARSGATAAMVTWAIVPVSAGEVTQGSDDEMQAALEALGYAVPTDEIEEDREAEDR